MTPEEQTRIDEIQAAFSAPEVQALLSNLVDGFNAIYDQNGPYNMKVEVVSHEQDGQTSWTARLVDAHSFPNRIIVTTVTPDKAVSAPEIIEFV